MVEQECIKCHHSMLLHEIKIDVSNNSRAKCWCKVCLVEGKNTKMPCGSGG
jgi:hypothetical protein